MGVQAAAAAAGGGGGGGGNNAPDAERAVLVLDDDAVGLAHACGVGAGVRGGEGEARDELAGREAREEVLLLLGGAVPERGEEFVVGEWEE